MDACRFAVRQKGIEIGKRGRLDTPSSEIYVDQSSRMQNLNGMEVRRYAADRSPDDI